MGIPHSLRVQSRSIITSLWVSYCDLLLFKSRPTLAFPTGNRQGWPQSPRLLVSVITTLNRVYTCGLRECFLPTPAGAMCTPAGKLCVPMGMIGSLTRYLSECLWIFLHLWHRSELLICKNAFLAQPKFSRAGQIFTLWAPIFIMVNNVCLALFGKWSQIIWLL